MKIKKFLTNNEIFKYYMFIIIIQILLILINSDDEPCKKTNNGKCAKASDANADCGSFRSHFEANVGDDCYNCPAGTVFYNIYSNGTCEDRSSVGCKNKIIFETNECVGHCPSNYYELGDFCYSDSSLDNTDLNLNIEITTDTPFKTCKCKYDKYNLTIVNGNKKRYDCFEEGKSCETGFYNSDTGKCVERCNQNEKIYYMLYCLPA